MKRTHILWLAGILVCAGWASNVSAATFQYLGAVDSATPVFEPLTPPGTPFRIIYIADDTAVAGGLVGPGDLESIAINFGRYCFGTGIFPNSDCATDTNVFIPITILDETALTYAAGIPTGGLLRVFASLPTDPIFLVDVDFSAGTFSIEVPFLGSASGTMALVPVPAAVWLFASAVLGLLAGLARRGAR